jgi:uncharacterized protein YeaO (DUF488 family)
MLKQGSVSQLRSGELSRKDGYIVVAMRFYPRGLKKELRDEYRSDLAPSLKLFQDFKKFEKKVGHDAAFEAANYRSRFELTPEGEANLKRLTELSRDKDVYLICQCEIGQRCHRELLLNLARKL